MTHNRDENKKKAIIDIHKIMSKKKKTYTQRFTRFGLKPMSIGVDQLRKQTQ